MRTERLSKKELELVLDAAEGVKDKRLCELCESALFGYGRFRDAAQAELLRMINAHQVTIVIGPDSSTVGIMSRRR